MRQYLQSRGRGTLFRGACRTLAAGMQKSCFTCTFSRGSIVRKDVYGRFFCDQQLFPLPTQGTWIPLPGRSCIPSSCRSLSTTGTHLRSLGCQQPSEGVSMIKKAPSVEGSKRWRISFQSPWMSVKNSLLPVGDRGFLIAAGEVQKGKMQKMYKTCNETC